MDLNTVAEVVSPAWIEHWRPGDAWLGGGTALFGEPRPHLRRLLDLTAHDWAPLTTTADGLEIAATCTIAELAASGYDLAERCCHAFLASFKIWNVATVGGNLCAALPAGPMIALGAALDGTCRLISSRGERVVPVREFVTGDGLTVLRPGELVRSMLLPASALAARTAYRQISLHTHGRSGALLIGRVDADGSFVLTVTGATRRPYVLRFPRVPHPEVVQIAVAERIPDSAYLDDVHGKAPWRRHMTRTFAEQIRGELAA